MLQLFKLIILFIVALYLSQLIKSFGYMSLAELRRRAETGDRLAGRVYAASRFGFKNSLILWLALSLVLAGLVIQISFWVDNGFFAVIIGTVFLLGFQLLAASLRWPKASLLLASQVGPLLGWLLANFAQADPNQADEDSPDDTSLLAIKSDPLIHSKTDHLEKLEKQLSQQQSPTSKAQIKLAIAALTFSDRSIAQVMTKRADIKTLSEDLEITTEVLANLHSQSPEVLPVVDSSKRRFVGILKTEVLFDQPVSLETVRIKDRMSKDVYYVKDKASLAAVFRAYLKTNQTFFLVIDKKQKVVGSINLATVIDNVLPVLIDKPVADDTKKAAPAKSSTRADDSDSSKK